MTAVSRKSRPQSSIALRSVAIDGTVRDLLATYQIRQTYENTTKKTLEVVYTFPLAWASVVTEFAAVVNGKRFVAEPLQRQTAEEKYEKAMEKGDQPMMLQCSDPTEGVCTANIGTLKPGETVELQISFAKLLTWTNGEVRLNIPTVVSGRYGLRQGDLLPHEYLHTNYLADYDETVHFKVFGACARGTVQSLSHLPKITSGTDCLEITITDAKADRDVAVNFTDVPEFVSALRVPSHYDEGDIGLVTCAKKGSAAPGKSVALKILVDCSGSMSGISIQKAKEALAALTEVLTGSDRISLSCFGSTVVHHIEEPALFTASYVRRDFLPVVEQIDADLGGTEMEAALKSVIALPEKDTDVLLITDGEIYKTKSVISFARQCGSRIFCIGVSSAPGQTVLQEMSAATGGTCLTTMPVEDMTEVMQQMVRAIRLDNVTVEAECGKQKESVRTFAGRSTHVFFHPGKDEDRVLISGTDIAWSRPADTGEIPMGLIFDRLMANDKQRRGTAGEELSEKYGLLGPAVSFVLVRERDEADKVDEMPQIQTVPQMAVESDVDALRITSGLSFRRPHHRQSNILALRSGSVDADSPMQELGFYCDPSAADEDFSGLDNLPDIFRRLVSQVNRCVGQQPVPGDERQLQAFVDEILHLLSSDHELTQWSLFKELECPVECSDEVFAVISLLALGHYDEPLTDLTKNWLFAAKDMLAAKEGLSPAKLRGIQRKLKAFYASA